MLLQKVSAFTSYENCGRAFKFQNGLNIKMIYTMNQFSNVITVICSNDKLFLTAKQMCCKMTARISYIKLFSNWIKCIFSIYR